MTDEPAATPGNAFEGPYRVRFDESTPGEVARTSALLRYAQDIAWAHSTSLGFDRAWYRERGLAWLVRAAELEVLGAIPVGATLDVSTAVIGHRRIWARRRGEFRLRGSLVAWVHTDWVLVDARGRITRVPDVFGTTFPAPEIAGPLTRVDLPPAPSAASRGSVRVRRHELDPMDHVNNAVYLDWLEEAVAAAEPARPGSGSIVDAIPRRYLLEYAAAAAAEAELETETWPDEAGWAFRVRAGSTDLLRGRVRA